ncbi:MAG: hypothetical protein IJA35_07600 [Clostridia bacterium]|nr:hypothetical protein [Clostridia bacterium]
MIDEKYMDEIGFTFVKNEIETCSPYGAELKRKLRFFKPEERGLLLEELENINKLCKAQELPEYKKISHMLMSLKDIRRSIVSIDSLTLNEIELFEIKRFLLQLDTIAPLFDTLNAKLELSGITINRISAALDILDPEKKRNPAFMLSGALSEKLSYAREQKRLIELQINSCTDAKRRESLLLKRAEFVAMEDAEETALKRNLCMELRPYAQEMLSTVGSIAKLDFSMAKAALAVKYGCPMPHITDKRLVLTNMFNPAVAYAIKSRSGGNFTPLSIELEMGASVLTGANMGGKSIVLYTIALNALCIQAGIFPFANSCEMPLFDNIYMVSGATGDYNKGLSSFGSEITQLNDAISGIEASGFSLMLVDELARGTNPDEGAAIVKGAVEYVCDMRCISLFATHYDGVAPFADRQYRVKGLCDTDMYGLKKRIDNSNKSRISIIEEAMSYGVYLVEDSSIVPHDALSICELLGTNPLLMNYIKKHY